MHELIALTDQLLQAIATGDWSTYEQLCDPMLTAFEPEACGNLVEGMPFHRFYFEMERSGRSVQTTMAQPTIRMLGADVAIVCYNRINQFIQPDGTPTSQSFEETRVWQRQDGRWKHVHFHRS